MYNQGNNYYPQVFVKKCKYTFREEQVHALPSDDNDKGFIEVSNFSKFSLGNKKI